MRTRQLKVVSGVRAPLHAGMSADPALRAVVSACLQQLLPAAVAVADGSADPEALHRLRVGIRRLRSVLRELGGWSGDCQPSWQAALSDIFLRLGRARDQDVLRATLAPVMAKAGAPGLTVTPPRVAESPAAIIRDPVWAALVAQLRQFADGERGGESQGGDLRRLAARRLRRLHRQVALDALRFESLDDSARHRLRKRLKRLRYCVELLAGLFPHRKVLRYLAVLSPAQDALGRCNDQTLALAWLRTQVGQQPQAWFGIGWLSARRRSQLRATGRALQQFACLPAFLRQTN